MQNLFILEKPFLYLVLPKWINVLYAEKIAMKKASERAGGTFVALTV